MSIQLETEIEPSGENWNAVKDDCGLCEMGKQTTWYYEDERIVVADTFSGHPFVVQKKHGEESQEGLIEHAHEVVDELFGQHSFETRMNKFPDHFHTHVQLGEEDGSHLVDE